MKKFILGKSSNFLSFFLDTLYSDCSDAEYIIIRNVPDDVETSHVSYLIPSMRVMEYSYDAYPDYPLESSYLMGVYSPTSKQRVYQFFYERYGIHSMCYQNVISNHAILPHIYTIGHGCFISHQCVIGPRSTLHHFVTINRNSSIGHHCTLHDFVTISPGVNMASHCVVGENTFLGIGATILNGITIGKNVVIGAGSVVTKDVPDNTVYYGSPAKYIRDNDTMSARGHDE